MRGAMYVPIPPAAVLPGAMPDFRIYVRTPQGRYVLWALEGNKVTAEQLGRLAEGGYEEIFVDLDDRFKYEQFVEENLGRILENPSAPDEQKGQIFSIVSTNVVKAAFETSLGFGSLAGEALLRTKQLIENAIKFITETKSLTALARMIGHDYETYEHATKVLWFTVAFLRQNDGLLAQMSPDYEEAWAGRREELLRLCGVAALLHDIGKALVPPDLLRKTDPLTEAEWEVMKRHPLSALAMLLETDLPLFVKKAVLHHHEDYHGGGYPLGLAGPSIPPLARVLRIVDVFDAMTSRRPYKDPFLPRQAAQIMIGERQDGQAPDERDLGMRHCFDRDLLKKFIIFLGDVRLAP